MPFRALACGLLALVALGSSACGGPDREAAAPRSACELVTDEQVTAAVGRPVVRRTAGRAADERGHEYCDWKDPSGKNVAEVGIYGDPIDAETKFAELRAGLFTDRSAPSPGIGDESFVELAGPAYAGSVVFRLGERVFTVRVKSARGGEQIPSDEDTARAGALNLARQVAASAAR